MSSHAPKRFEVNLVRTPAGLGRIDAGPRPLILGGVPPEFGGTDDVWSPEHLLVASAALCFQTTFDWFARRAQLSVDDFRCRAEGVVEKRANGLAFTSIRLDVRLTVPAGDGKRARELVTSAKRACLVTNSLLPIVELMSDVVETAAPALHA